MLTLLRGEPGKVRTTRCRESGHAASDKGRTTLRTSGGTDPESGQEVKDKVDALEGVPTASREHAKQFLDDSRAPPTSVDAHAGLAAFIYDKPGSHLALTFKEDVPKAVAVNDPVSPSDTPLSIEGCVEIIEAARGFGVEE